PLDGEGRWHRFHALFRDLLQRRLRQRDDGGLERTLQRRAADWLAADGQVEEAVRLYLAAGEDDAAAHVMEQALAREMGRDVIAAPPGYLLRLLPVELIRRRPGLSLLEARLGAMLLNPSALAASLARVDALLAEPEYAAAPPPWPSFFGDLAVLRGTLRGLQGRPAEVIALMQEALTLQPVPVLVGQALLLMGRAYAADGRYAEGVRRIHQELTVPTVKGNPQHAVHCYASLCSLHSIVGSIADLERDTAKLANAGMALRPSENYYGYVHSNLGRVAYELSRLEVAAHHFGMIAQHRYYATTPIALGAMTGLGMIAAIQGDYATAEAWQRETWEFAHELGTPYARHQALGLAVWLALRRDDRQTALRLAREIEPDIHVGAYGWFALQPPLVIQVQTLITAGDREEVARGETLLKRLRAAAEALHNIRPLVAILVCQALLFQARGQRREARGSIGRAVELAMPRGYLRTFVDFGPAIAPLLQLLAGEGIATVYLRPILAALEPSAVRPGHVAGPEQRPRLPEALSRREREILALLAERWSNQEIAERLHITLNTVRKHTSTIYNKLGVSGRREAVAVARTLGLLPGQ
ncbi:MAG: LuxR C-terminal-related transcriptional regulator, partial [Chloroflexaceae bacterium]|nr:LuxR C-terminal-related transcriptional regulator [Chloroflexaceae bacterium]